MNYTSNSCLDKAEIANFGEVTMAKSTLLTLGNFEDAYFEDCLLLGIKSNDPITVFCVEAERRLGIKFERKLSNDILVRYTDGFSSGLGIAGTLFEFLPQEQDVKFSFYQHKVPFSDLHIHLFDNHYQDYRLIPECKQYDFLILLHDPCYTLQQKPLQYWLPLLNSVACCQEIAIESLGKSKENLII